MVIRQPDATVYNPITLCVTRRVTFGTDRAFPDSDFTKERMPEELMLITFGCFLRSFQLGLATLYLAFLRDYQTLDFWIPDNKSKGNGQT